MRAKGQNDAAWGLFSVPSPLCSALSPETPVIKNGVPESEDMKETLRGDCLTAKSGKVGTLKHLLYVVLVLYYWYTVRLGGADNTCWTAME